MGYFNNSNGLRLNINRSWKTKAFSFRSESLSVIYFQRQLLEFFEVFMNARKFHRRGMVLSHIVTKAKGLNKLELNVFVYDPSVIRHSNKIYDLLVGDSFLPKKLHLVRKRILNVNKMLPQVLRDTIEELALEYRHTFYNGLSTYVKSKFLKMYPKLDLNIRFVSLRPRMINAEFLARFFIMKFQYKRDLVRIVNPVSSRLLRRFGGVRIDCRGRFTKQQRAGKFNFRHGTVSLNNFSQRVDYSQVALPLKYGACSIKLWLANRLISKEYGSEQRVTNFNSFDIMKLPIQRQNLSKYTLSLGKNKVKRSVAFNSTRVPLTKIIKIGKVGGHRLTPKKRNMIAFTATSFYNRRAKLGKQILLESGLSKLSQDRKFKFLSKLLQKKAPSWYRKWPSSYRFLTARELSKSVEKEVSKIKRDSVKYHAHNRALLTRILSLKRYKYLKKPFKGVRYDRPLLSAVSRFKKKRLNKRLEKVIKPKKRYIRLSKYGKTRK